MLFETKPEKLERKRRRAIYFLQQGKSVSYVAKVTKRSKKTIYRWQISYKRNGAGGLRCRPSKGRPPKLNQDQKDKIAAILEKMAGDFFQRERYWSIHFATTLIKKQFGIDYHPSHVWKVLRAMRWNYQKYSLYHTHSNKIRRYVRGSWKRRWY